MKSLPKYCSVTSEYDLDHIINEVVDKTQTFVEEVKYEARTDDDAKALLKAVVTTIIDRM